MTDAAPPRASAPIALLFAILGFIIAAAVAGVYLWDRQKKDEDHNIMIIDQLRRIDERLGKMETAQQQIDTGALAEKLDELNVKVAESKSADSGVISQQLQIIIEHQIKLQNDLAEIREARIETAQQQATQNSMKQQQQGLLRDLQNIAPTLLTPQATDDFWSKITSSWQRWVTIKPMPSAGADTTTTSGKISRALYDLEQGDVQAALNVLPDDPRLASFRKNAENYIAQIKAAETPAPAAEEATEEKKPLLHLPVLPTPPAEGETP